MTANAEELARAGEALAKAGGDGITRHIFLCAEPQKGECCSLAVGAPACRYLKKRLKELGRWLAEVSGAPLKVFVDTAPVMEKPLAQVAGLGWQGKHTNLVSRDFGSWLFLGEIFTRAELPPDEPEIDHCGSCAACQDICPTAAFPAPLPARCAAMHLVSDDRT